jgi:Tol biopolymer transport system component
LTSKGGPDFEPSWAPDGHQVVYTHGLDEAADLFTLVVPAAGGKVLGNLFHLRRTRRMSATRSSVVPGRTHLAFPKTGRKLRPVLFDLATKQVKQLTTTQM